MRLSKIHFGKWSCVFRKIKHNIDNSEMCLILLQQSFVVNQLKQDMLYATATALMLSRQQQQQSTRQNVMQAVTVTLVIYTQIFCMFYCCTSTYFPVDHNRECIGFRDKKTIVQLDLLRIPVCGRDFSFSSSQCIQKPLLV